MNKNKTQETPQSHITSECSSETQPRAQQHNGESQDTPFYYSILESSTPSAPSRPPKRARMHKDDLDPYTSDFYSHLISEDIPDWNTDDLLIGQDEDLPPEARKCPVDVRRMIRNAHNNLGHPSNYALVRLMRTAKCHPDMIAYARHTKCASCSRRKPPSRIPHVSLPYRPTRFNSVVGIDLKWVKDAKGENYYMLNILCLATALLFATKPLKVSQLHSNIIG